MKVESFAHACTLRGYDQATVLPDVSNYPTQHQKALLSFAMLVIISEAINEGKEFDWDDDDQYKRYPLFDMEVSKNNPSGFRFYDAVYGLAGTTSTGGSRLCYHSSADAEHAATHFIEMYKAIMVIEK
ncbi:MAG: hypothetical protein Q8L07_04155 [Sediminibacterium sp.]|nr:hypothetical protein [Sediminibacterium sp.]